MFLAEHALFHPWCVCLCVLHVFGIDALIGHHGNSVVKIIFAKLSSECHFCFDGSG